MRKLMTSRNQAALILSACLLTTALWAQTQEKTLADIARAARKNKPSTHASGKVYDNDNLNNRSTISVVGSGESVASADGPSAEAKTAPATGDSPQFTPEELKREKEYWRAKAAEQDKKVDELYVELRRLEGDNVGLRAEYEDAMTGKQRLTVNNACSPLPQGGALCRETERDKQYQAYAKQHDALKVDLDAARKTLEELKEKVRQLDQIPN